MTLLIGIFLLIMGLFMIVSPVGFYNLTESWKNNSFGEPSDFFKFSTRFGGVAMVIVGIGEIIVFFLN